MTGLLVKGSKRKVTKKDVKKVRKGLRKAIGVNIAIGLFSSR